MYFSRKVISALFLLFAVTSTESAWAQVQFNLNFDPESGFYDTTDWSSESGGQYATYGDALRGEMQVYLDTVIAPTFGYDEPRILSIDITDGLTGPFATGGTSYHFKEISPNRFLSVPKTWDILVNNHNPDPASSDGQITYNLDVDARYSGDRAAMLRNVAGGLTRHELNHVLGMSSSIPAHRDTFDPRGLERSFANVYDRQLRDQSGNELIDGYRSWSGSEWVNPAVSQYEVSNNWSNNGSGLYFQGVGDNGAPLNIGIASASTRIDFDHLIGSFADSTRQANWDPNTDLGSNFWDAVIELDRAFYRGMSYHLAGEPSPFQLGDVNCDGSIDFLDIAPFIAILSSGTFEDKADIDRDGNVGFLDIVPFIALLAVQ